MTQPSTAPRGLYGKRDPDPYRPALRLGPLLTGVVPARPVAADYLAQFAGTWKMLGNDVKGDCVSVAWANIRRLVSAVLGGTEFYPDQAMVDAVYATQNPGGSDNGMMIQLLLEYLTKTAGPDGAKVIAFAKVDPSNLEEVKAAIAIFGFVLTGFTVQRANEIQFSRGLPWDYVSGSPDVGGHAVITGGYGAPGPGTLAGDARFETWTQETSFTDAFWLRNVDECWAVIWPEYLGSKAFLEGVDQAALAAAYTAITHGGVLPIDVPPVVPPVVPPGPGPVVGPDAWDETLYHQTLAWSQARHAGSNRAAALAVREWAAEKGITS